MQTFKSKRTGKIIEIQEIPVSSMMLLPPKPDVGRDATWNDAMAHCTDDVKERWIEGLKIHGVEVV